jgi:hypothetical protein
MANILIGAALALVVQLVVQLGVVPMVQSRARRAGRWEQAVRDLKELLKTSLSDRGTDARAAQGLYGDLVKLAAEPGQDPDRIARIRDNHVWEIRKATRAFTDLAHTRVGLLTDEIMAFKPGADELAKLEIISRQYWLAVAFISGWKEDDTEGEIDDRWSREYQERTALLAQVRLLAGMHRPPRASMRRRWRRRVVPRLGRAIAS